MENGFSAYRRLEISSAISPLMNPSPARFLVDDWVYLGRISSDAGISAFLYIYIEEHIQLFVLTSHLNTGISAFLNIYKRESSAFRPHRPSEHCKIKFPRKTQSPTRNQAGLGVISGDLVENFVLGCVDSLWGRVAENAILHPNRKALDLASELISPVSPRHVGLPCPHGPSSFWT